MKFITGRKQSGMMYAGDAPGRKAAEVGENGQQGRQNRFLARVRKNRVKRSGQDMTKAREIRKSLIDQLIAKGADVKLYRALIDDYMWFYQQFHQMQADIKQRGRTNTTVSAQGKDYEKNNPCVKDALLYSHQMVAILRALGLSTGTIIPPNSGGENDEGSDKHDL